MKTVKQNVPKTLTINDKRLALVSALKRILALDVMQGCACEVGFTCPVCHAKAALDLNGYKRVAP